MARHKKIETEEQGEPEMSISSMIDCCFLLLIYFLVATSLVSEKKLDISVPSDSSSSTPKKNNVDPGRVTVREDGSVFWNDDIQVAPELNLSIEPGQSGYKEQRHLNDLVDQLITIRDQAKAADTEPIVTLKGHPKAKQQRIVDVMAAMAEAQIQTVGLSVMSE